MTLQIQPPDGSLVIGMEGMQGQTVLTIWLDSSSLHLAQNIWYRSLFTSEVWVAGTYMWQVISCSFSKGSGETFHERPSSLKASRGVFSDFINFMAPIFLRPANALTMSQPVYACIPTKVSQTLSPSEWTSLFMSRNLVRFCVPHFWLGHEISLLKSIH